MRPTQDICIVLGVYNGSAYLKQQIKSLLSQRGLSYEILSRDDGSQDNSYAILKEFSNRNPRFFFLQDKKANLGVVGNFSLLMNAAVQTSCEYVACSDQDDVWCENKLFQQLVLMHKLEEAYPNKPVLIHSDLEVVDSNLNCMDRSFMRYKGIWPEASNPLKVLLASNFVTGCTILANRRLLELALPFPKEAVLHDWWLALCAAAFGQIRCVHKPLVKYRQHGHNEIGARAILDLMNPFKTNVYQYWLRAKVLLLQTIAQAGALSERVRAHEPSNTHLPLIERYASLEALSPYQRIKAFKGLGIHGQGFLRHLFLIFRLLNLPSEHGK